MACGVIIIHFKSLIIVKIINSQARVKLVIELKFGVLIYTINSMAICYK